MVRKHSRYTRARSKRSRPKTPAPTNAWVIAELSRISGTSPRTIRYYVQQGLIHYLERRGTATRYPRASLLRLLALPALQFEMKVPLLEIKRRMETLGEAGLEAWVAAHPLSSAASLALGIQTTTPARADTSRPTAIQLSSSVQRVNETWLRIQLLPGLELMLRADASAAVRAAAERIEREFIT